MPVELIIDDSVSVEVISPTEAQKAKKSITGIVYHLRFTFVGKLKDEDLSSQQWWCRYITGMIKPYIVNDIWIASIEHFKKGMEVTTPHIHFVFMSEYDKETIRKQFIRKMENPDPELSVKVTGNKMYSLSAKANNNIKEWRYPLKQQKNETKRFTIMGTGYRKYMEEEFGAVSAEQLRDEAYAVWLTACEVHDAKEQKEAQRGELQDRLFVYLDNLDNLDSQSIKVAIQKFYIDEEKKPFNKTTALGYYYAYKIKRGLMTHEQLAATW